MSKQLTMTARVVLFAALALAGALAIFAFSASQPVAAQTTSTDDVTRSISATGETVDVTITLNTSEHLIVNVTETLPSGWDYQSARSVKSSTVSVVIDDTGSEQMISFYVLAGDPVTYTVTAAGSGTFSGMFTVPPETFNTPIGGTTMVTVAADAAGENGEPGPVKLSTDRAGADVRVTIDANAVSSIRGGTDISVTLPGFGIPSSIDEDDVIIYSNNFDGNPSSIEVDGSKITLAVPLRTGSGTDTRTTFISGPYTILFKSSAGLTNPTLAGDKDVTVSDADPEDEKSPVTIIKTVSVKPTFVTRGGDATVTAKGLRDGTTTVYLMDDDEQGAELGSGTADDGVVEIEIDTSGLDAGATVTVSGDSDVGMNTLRVIDANNEKVGEDVTIGIKPTVKLGSDSAKRSASLEISVSDWYYGDIYKVTVGGIEVEDVDEDDNLVGVGSDEKETFNVTVPGGVRTGEQEVKVYGDEGLNTTDEGLNTTSATATVTISVLGLDVSPSSVVPGQQVTITGSGFAKSTDIEDGGITIYGMDADVPGDAKSTSSGNVAVTTTVPLEVGYGKKKVELRVGSRTGVGEITVAEPSIMVSPEESLVGSTISVTGTGFASNGRVEVEYNDDIEEVGLADSDGNFSITLTVPSDAGIGAPNKVEVKVRGAESIKASADHKTPSPKITVTQDALVGGTITVSGTSFKSFSVLESVMVGGQNAKPSPAPVTDKDGNFEFKALVPRLGVGSHTVTVEDGDQNSATETFTVVAELAEPVVEAEPEPEVMASTDPADVFASLGSRLVRVWYLDRATQVWSFYDPDSNVAAFNTLTEVTSGMNVSIIISQGDSIGFQAGFLYQGTNPIALK